MILHCAFFPPSYFADVALFSTLSRLSLCHYGIIGLEGASLQQRKPKPVLSHVQLDLYPISQLCPFLQMEYLDGLLLHNPLRES